MKEQLYLYAVLVLLFIAYNLFFQVKDSRLNEIINILFSSFLFLYIGYLAYLVLKKLKNTSK